MLQRRSEIFRSALLIGDVLCAGLSWLAAYGVRFSGAIPAPLGVPPFRVYLLALLVLIPLWVWVLRRHGLYAPRRIDSPFRDLVSVAQAGTTVVVLLITLTFFLRSYFFSRGVMLLFWVFSIASVAAFRVAARKIVRVIHRRGRYLNPVLVVGAGRLAEELIERIGEHPEAGLRVVGVVADDPEIKRVRGVPVLGRTEQIRPILHLSGAIEVMLALSQSEGARAGEILAELEDELVDVRLVPDLFQILTLRASVEDLDGLPVIAIRQSPLVGWAAIQKRIFDIAIAGAALLLVAPLMALIAAAIALTSGLPVFYRQDRMGLDGRIFRMLKFRTMVRDAERHTGPVWARERDPRQTWIGGLLRQTSLDELPQLWNVLRGDMSLVGPRPERPVFIERFRREVPGYMLRHKVKSGLTGWAQIHHWRGDTSLHERVEHDLYYIQNWTLALDIRILLMTLWRGWTRPQASSG